MQNSQKQISEDNLIHQVVDYLKLECHRSQEFFEESYGAAFHAEDQLNAMFANEDKPIITEKIIDGFREVQELELNITFSSHLLAAHYFEKLLDENSVMLDERSFGHALSCLHIYGTVMPKDIKQKYTKRLKQLSPDLNKSNHKIQMENQHEGVHYQVGGLENNLNILKTEESKNLNPHVNKPGSKNKGMSL